MAFYFKFQIVALLKFLSVLLQVSLMSSAQHDRAFTSCLWKANNVSKGVVGRKQRYRLITRSCFRKTTNDHYFQGTSWSYGHRFIFRGNQNKRQQKFKWWYKKNVDEKRHSQKSFLLSLSLPLTWTFSFLGWIAI